MADIIEFTEKYDRGPRSHSSRWEVLSPWISPAETQTLSGLVWARNEVSPLPTLWSSMNFPAKKLATIAWRVAKRGQVLIFGRLAAGWQRKIQ